MKNNYFAVCVSVAFLILGLSANGFAEQGVTETEIHIGQWGPQTGPAAPWGAVARGTDAYFNMINDEGGIHGRKLILHYFDDEYNPAKTLAGVKQLQEDVGMFAWVAGVGTETGLAVKAYLTERKIPWIGPSSGSTHWVDPPNKYIFAVSPCYSGDSQVLVHYAVKNLLLKKIAIVYQDDDYGKLGLSGADYQAEKEGISLVARVPVDVSDNDLKPQVMELRKVRAQAVLMFVTPGHVARLIGIGKAVNFRPQWMTSNTCADYPLMMAITKGLYAGTITVGAGLMDPKAIGIGNLDNPDEPSLPLLKEFYKKGYRKYAAKDERWGFTFASGMAYAEPFVEGLRRVGRDLTREKLVRAMEGITDHKGIMGNISYKPFDPKDPLCRLGQKEVFVIQATKEGGTKILTDWIKTDYVNYQ